MSVIVIVLALAVLGSLGVIHKLMLLQTGNLGHESCCVHPHCVQMFVTFVVVTSGQRKEGSAMWTLLPSVLQAVHLP